MASSVPGGTSSIPALKKTVKLSYNNSHKRLLLSGDDFDSHWERVKDTITSKYRLSLNENCHLVTTSNKDDFSDLKVVASSKSLESALLETTVSTLSFVVQDGKPPMKAINDGNIKVIVVFNDSTMEWVYDTKSFGSNSFDNRFDAFQTDVKSRFGIPEGKSLLFFEIDDVNDTSNTCMSIDCNEDFVCCFEDEPNVVHFMLKLDASVDVVDLERAETESKDSNDGFSSVTKSMTLSAAPLMKPFGWSSARTSTGGASIDDAGFVWPDDQVLNSFIDEVVDIALDQFRNSLAPKPVKYVGTLYSTKTNQKTYFVLTVCEFLNIAVKWVPFDKKTHPSSVFKNIPVSANFGFIYTNSDECIIGPKNVAMSLIQSTYAQASQSATPRSQASEHTPVPELAVDANERYMHLLGRDKADMGYIRNWLVCANEIERNYADIIYPIMKRQPWDTNKCKKSIGYFFKLMKKMNQMFMKWNHDIGVSAVGSSSSSASSNSSSSLSTRVWTRYLVRWNEMSVADLAVASALLPLYKFVFTQEMLRGIFNEDFDHVTVWYLNVVNCRQYNKILHQFEDTLLSSENGSEPSLYNNDGSIRSFRLLSRNSELDATFQRILDDYVNGNTINRQVNIDLHSSELSVSLGDFRMVLLYQCQEFISLYDDFLYQMFEKLNESSDSHFIARKPMQLLESQTAQEVQIKINGQLAQLKALYADNSANSDNAGNAGNAQNDDIKARTAENVENYVQSMQNMVADIVQQQSASKLIEICENMYDLQAQMTNKTSRSDVGARGGMPLMRKMKTLAEVDGFDSILETNDSDDEILLQMKNGQVDKHTYDSLMYDISITKYLSLISNYLSIARSDNMSLSSKQDIALKVGYLMLKNGGKLTSNYKSLGIPGYRDFQTYLFITDPGPGHLNMITKNKDLMRGVTVHVEYIDRESVKDKKLIEPYRMPSSVHMSYVRLNVANSAPTSCYIGRPMFEGLGYNDNLIQYSISKPKGAKKNVKKAIQSGSDVSHADIIKSQLPNAMTGVEMERTYINLFKCDLLKTVHYTAGCCTSAFNAGICDAKISIENMTRYQIIKFMRGVTANVMRDSERQYLSAAFNLFTNIYVTDESDESDMPATSKNGNEYAPPKIVKIVSDPVAIAKEAINITVEGGFDKVTWDGASNKVPSDPIIKLLGFETLLELVHMAHEKGLITYISAGMEPEHIPEAVYTGVDGIGIGTSLHYRDAKTGLIGAFDESVINACLETRNKYASSIRGKGAKLLAALDWQHYEKSIDLSVEPDREKLYLALKNKDEDKISEFVEKYKYLYNADNTDDFEIDNKNDEDAGSIGLFRKNTIVGGSRSNVIGRANRILQSENPILRAELNNNEKWESLKANIKHLVINNNRKDLKALFAKYG